MDSVYLLFVKSHGVGGERLDFIDVFATMHAADRGIERHRDERDHPPDLNDYVIQCRTPKGPTG